MRSHYYAGKGNRFWAILRDIGLTAGNLLSPSEWRKLDGFDVGLTDLAKTASGADFALRPDMFDCHRLRASVAENRPRILAFNGKKAGEVFLGRKVQLGLQSEPSVTPAFGFFHRLQALRMEAGTLAIGTTFRRF